MARYNLISMNGGVRKTYDGVWEVQVLDDSTVRMVGSVDDTRLTTQTMAIIHLAPGERLERTELYAEK